MNSSGDICQTTGQYSAYSPCGHSDERLVIQGEVFPHCRDCAHVVAWTLLHATDRWGDNNYEWEAADSRYRGMTTNERLFAANLMDDFDKAIRQRDRVMSVYLLQKVGLTLPAAERVVDDTLKRQQSS